MQLGQFQEALRIQPSDAVLRNNLGIALFNLGEKREAVDQFRQALDADPNYGPASENLRKTAPLINENP